MSGSTPVGDDDDTTFGVMAGAAVLIAVVVSVLMPLSSGGTTNGIAAIPGATVTSTTSADVTTTTLPPGTATTPPPTIPAPTVEEVQNRLVSAGFPSVTATIIDHEVTLTGTIGSESIRTAVLGVARSIDGVTSVVDNLVVG